MGRAPGRLRAGYGPTDDPSSSWWKRSPPRCGTRSAPTARSPRSWPRSRPRPRPAARRRPAGAPARALLEHRHALHDRRLAWPASAPSAPSSPPARPGGTACSCRRPGPARRRQRKPHERKRGRPAGMHERMAGRAIRPCRGGAARPARPAARRAGAGDADGMGLVAALRALKLPGGAAHDGPIDRDLLERALRRPGLRRRRPRLARRLPTASPSRPAATPARHRRLSRRCR